MFWPLYDDLGAPLIYTRALRVTICLQVVLEVGVLIRNLLIFLSSKLGLRLVVGPLSYESSGSGLAQSRGSSETFQSRSFQEDRTV